LPYILSSTFEAKTMDDEELADMHRFLAEHHRKLAREAMLDVVTQYHADLAQRLADEAALVGRRASIAEEGRIAGQGRRGPVAHPTRTCHAALP
jgi:hypothetical protein